MTPYAAALGAALGAWWSAPVPAYVVAIVWGAALWSRAWAVIGLAMLLLASFVGARALAGLNPPSEGVIDAWVTLVDDPRPLAARGVRATVRWEGRRLEALAYGTSGARLDDRLAGERVHIVGRVRPVDSDWLRWRHVVGRVTITQIVDHDSAAPLFSAANWVRRRLATGAQSLPRVDRSLFTGMVIGDDRDQTAVIADDFRAAGLGHLLVVSGQNVAFVLALAGPLTTRLRPGGRLMAIAVVLLVFAVLTRFEPSVMRAVCMAGLAVGAAVLGRPESGRRVLAAAVAVLVIVDPFLIHVLAFQLSVAATAGIVWITPRIAAAVPGPRAVVLAFATTAGAQLAVSPLLVTTFGTVPLASLPANLLAGPASGPVMMWGLTGGAVAGVLGGRAAAVIHLPTAALIWWVREIAAAAAKAPPAALGGAGTALLIAGVLAVIVSRSGVARVAGAALIAVVFIGAILRAPTPPPGWSSVGGASVWRSDGVTLVLLDDAGPPERLLADLRRRGVGRPDLVVAVDGGVADAAAVVALGDRFGALPVLAPPLHRVPGARTARLGQRVRIADSIIEIVGVDPVAIRVSDAVVGRS